MLRVGEDWTITPSMLNHLLLNFNRIISKNYSVVVKRAGATNIQHGLRACADHF